MFGVLSFNLESKPVITVVSPLSWLEISPSTDSQFSQKVNGAIAPGVGSALASVLPYSVVVTNKGREPIAGLDILFKVKFGDKIVRRNFIYHTFSQPDRFVVPVGQSRLFTPLKTANALAAGAPTGTGGNSGPLSSQSDTTALQGFASADEIEISIDLAVAPDGKTAGSDESQTVKRLNQEKNAYRIMHDECLGRLMSGYSDASIQEWLGNIASQPVPKDPDVPFSDRWINTQVGLAKAWINYFRTGQRSALLDMLQRISPDIMFPVIGSLKEGLQ